MPFGANTFSGPTTGVVGLEAGVDRLALEGQDGKHALVYPAQRLLVNKTLEPLETEGEFTRGERSLRAKTALSQALEMRGLCVVGPVDKAQVLAAADLERRLHDPALPPRGEVRWLDHHALAAARGQRLPPLDRALFAGGVGEVDGHGGVGDDHRAVHWREPTASLEMPGVRLGDMN